MREAASVTKIVRQLRSGQITIPAEFRRRLGIEEDSVLAITLTGNELHIKPVRVEERGQGSLWLKELYEYFAPVRDEAEAGGLSGEEIDEAIDRAVAAVRSRNG